MNGRINTNSCVENMILNINTQVNVLYSGATKGQGQLVQQTMGTHCCHRRENSQNYELLN